MKKRKKEREERNNQKENENLGGLTQEQYPLNNTLALTGVSEFTEETREEEIIK